MVEEDVTMDKPAAFEDESKEDLFRRILSSASQAEPVDLIGPDAHRARAAERRRADATPRSAY